MQRDTKKEVNNNETLNETMHSRIDQVKYLKAVFHKFYLVHSGIIVPNKTRT